MATRRAPGWLEGGGGGLGCAQHSSSQVLPAKRLLHFLRGSRRQATRPRPGTKTGNGYRSARPAPGHCNNAHVIYVTSLLGMGGVAAEAAEAAD